MRISFILFGSTQLARTVGYTNFICAEAWTRYGECPDITKFDGEAPVILGL